MKQRSGTVVAAFGRRYEVELPSGERIACVTRGKRSDLACGDRVELSLTSAGEGVVETRLPRDNLLHRSDAFREKWIAANLSLVVIVVATEPGFSDLLISRCLCGAEDQDLAALIVLNKTDLLPLLPQAREQLGIFQRLGYEILEVSAHGEVGALRQRLHGHRSLFVGQSGMGKSSLLNALVPGTGASTREISTALASGKHTTTFARLYRVDAESELIDSPGLQAFGLAHLDTLALEEGFREFRPLLGHCRFRDCRHGAEPGCALRTALAEGRISARRFAHYEVLREELEYAQKLRGSGRA